MFDHSIAKLPSCPVCRKPVRLESAKEDESGRAIHEGCYLIALQDKAASGMKKPVSNLRHRPMQNP
ncbi:MAG: hypothetical protein DMG79_11230 [Acidobacteria bacterium]|nr:MAG: hypothetical protein DMG79_11230 [Acidobacteriota bacterium]